MKVAFRIKRFNPETDAKPRWETYVIDAEQSDRVVDGLCFIKARIDGSLSFRHSCGHGMCGSDAMMINGRNRLACQTLIKDVAPKVIVEPLRGLPLLKDLVVDLRPFFAKYRAIKPYLINDTPLPQTERLQSPEERARFDDTTKCIMCAACTTSCPSFWANSEYVGPAAIVQAHRFIFDSRDEATKERLEVLNQWNGVWRCRTIFNCVSACPRKIDVTKAIGEVKKLLLFGR